MEDDNKEKPSDDSENNKDSESSKKPSKKRGDGEWSLGEDWKESADKDSGSVSLGSEADAEPVAKPQPKKKSTGILLKVAFFLFSTVFITLCLLQLNSSRKQKVSLVDNIKIETAPTDGTDVPLPPTSFQTSSSQQVDDVVETVSKTVVSSLPQESLEENLPPSSLAISSRQRSSSVVLSSPIAHSSSERVSSALSKSRIASSEPPRQDFSHVAIKGSIQLLDKNGNIVDTTRHLEKEKLLESTWVTAITTKDVITDERFAEYVGSQTVLGLLDDDSLKVIDSFIMEGAGYRGEGLQAVDIRGKFSTLKPETLKNGNYSLVLSINGTVVTSTKLVIGSGAQAIVSPPIVTATGDDIKVTDISTIGTSSSVAGTATPLSSLQQLPQLPSPPEEPVRPTLPSEPEPSRQVEQPTPVLGDSSYQSQQEPAVSPQSASSVAHYAAYAERYSGMATLTNNSSGEKTSRNIILAVDFYADNTIQGEATVSNVGAMAVRGKLYDRGLEMVLISSTDAIQLTGVKRGTTIRGRFTSGTLKESGSFEIMQSQ